MVKSSIYSLTFALNKHDKLIVRALILFFLVSMNAYAIDCHKGILQFLKKNSQAPLDEIQFKLLKQTQELEKRTNKLRIKKSNQEPAINLKIWKKIAKYDALLANDSYSQVTRELRPLFREVESAHVIITRYRKVITILESTTFESAEVLTTKLVNEGVHSELAEAVAQRYIQNAGDTKAMTNYYQKVIDESAIHLGHFYHEYKLIRTHLEGILNNHNCDNHCAVNTRNLLDAIGVDSFTDQERFSVLLKGADSPSFADLNKTLNSHPLAYTTRLKRERDEEFKLFWKGLFYELLPLDEIERFILKTPGLNKSKVIRMFRVLYDRTARLIHFPKINRVMRSPQEVAEKFDLFLQLNTTIVPEDEFMVTFARRIDNKTKDSWEELYQFAEQNQQRYPDIFQRMNGAKEKAMARGEISLVEEKSFTTKLAIIVTGGVYVAYWWYNKEEVTEIIDQLDKEDQDEIVIPPTEEEIKNFDIIGNTISVKLGSNEDKEFDQFIDDTLEITKDLKNPERLPNSKKIWVEPIRLIKEI